MASPMFACLIPGRPALMDFKQVDPKKFVTGIASPHNINEFAISLLQPTIPPGSAIGIYYSLPPFKEWIYMGMISLQSPTVFLRAAWKDSLEANTPGVQLGLSLDSLEALSKLPTSDAKEEEKQMDSAKGIASDLYKFMASFSQSTGQYQNLGNVLVIPTNCIDKWFKKFNDKHRLDPYFWMKKQA